MGPAMNLTMALGAAPYGGGKEDRIAKQRTFGTRSIPFEPMMV